VGIYDKVTGTLRLHQAASKGTVYSLQQHLPDYDEDVVEHASNNKETLSLFKDFGSAKKRRTLKSQQDNRVNVDAVIGTGKAVVDSLYNNKNNNNKDSNMTNNQNQMSESNRQAVELAKQLHAQQKRAGDNVAGNNLAAMPSASELASNELRQSMLPPFKMDAANPYDVYDFTKIIGESTWDNICAKVDKAIRESMTGKIPMESDDDDAEMTETTENFWEALSRGKENEEGEIPTPEKRGWNPSTLDVLKYVTRKGIPEKAAKEDAATASEHNSANHQLRCILLYHILAKFYSKFWKNAKSRTGRLIAGPEGSAPRWFGIPKTGALVLFDKFTLQRISENANQQSSFLEFLNKDDPTKKSSTRIHQEDGPKFQMPSAQKDKCLIHILLVYLMARGGAAMMVDDITPVIEDLGLDAKKAGALMRLAGCTVQAAPAISSSNKIKALLKVPLTFPKGGRGRG